MRAEKEVLLMVDEIADKMTESAMTNLVQEPAGIEASCQVGHRSVIRMTLKDWRGCFECCRNCKRGSGKVDGGTRKKISCCYRKMKRRRLEESKQLREEIRQQEKQHE
jgi:hypothetical protein